VTGLRRADKTLYFASSCAADRAKTVLDLGQDSSPRTTAASGRKAPTTTSKTTYDVESGR